MSNVNREIQKSRNTNTHLKPYLENTQMQCGVCDALNPIIFFCVVHRQMNTNITTITQILKINTQIQRNYVHFGVVHCTATVLWCWLGQ